MLFANIDFDISFVKMKGLGFSLFLSDFFFFNKIVKKRGGVVRKRW